MVSEAATRIAETAGRWVGGRLGLGEKVGGGCYDSGGDCSGGRRVAGDDDGGNGDSRDSAMGR